MLKIHLAIDRNLHIDKLKEDFAQWEVFATDDIFQFYQQFKQGMLKSTVNWRIYELVKRGILERTGKGKFRLSSRILYTPELNTKHFKINAAIKDKFPFINFCVWDSSFISEFSQHISKASFTLVDVERGAEESVHYLLKEQFTQVFLMPGKDLLNNYLSDLKKIILVRRLVSEAPCQKIRNIPIATLEKILVDIYTDEEFTYLEGDEMTLIFRTAFERYTISESKLIRYADRKRKKKQLLDFLNKIKVLHN